VASKVVTTVTR